MASQRASTARPFGREGNTFFAHLTPGTAAMHHCSRFSRASMKGLSTA